MSPFAWKVVESDLWVKLRDPGPLHQPAAMAGHGDERIGAETVEISGKQLRLDSSNRNLQSICIYIVCIRIYDCMFRNILYGWFV